MSFSFNLTTVPENKQLALWSEYVLLSQEDSPEWLQSIFYKGHFYLHQSTLDSNQFSLEMPSILGDSAKRRLTLEMIIEITLKLMDKAEDPSVAQIVLQSLQGKATELPRGLQPLANRCRGFAPLTENPLRGRIKILRHYLASKKIFGAYTHKLERQVELLENFTKDYWEKLKLSGIYYYRCVDNKVVKEPTPEIPIAESLLAEFTHIPDSLTPLYTEVVKKKMAGMGEASFYRFPRRDVSSKLMRILEKCHSDLILQQLKEMETKSRASTKKNQLTFTFAGECPPIETQYVRTFKWYLHEHPDPLRIIHVAHYHAGVLDLLEEGMATFKFEAINQVQIQAVCQKLSQLSDGNKVPICLFPKLSEECRNSLKRFVETNHAFYYFLDAASVMRIKHKPSYREAIVAEWLKAKVVAIKDDPLAIEMIPDERLKNIDTLHCFAFHPALLSYLTKLKNCGFRDLTDSNAILLVKKLKEIHGSRQERVPYYIYIDPASLTDSGKEAVDSLLLPPGPYEPNLYVEEGDVFASCFVKECKEQCTDAFANFIKKREEAELKELGLVQKGKQFISKTQKIVDGVIEDPEEQKLRREEVRKQNLLFLNNLSSRPNRFHEALKVELEQKKLSEEVRAKRQRFLAAVQSAPKSKVELVLGRRVTNVSIKNSVIIEAINEEQKKLQEEVRKNRAKRFPL